jgi:hypothetical protein
VFVFVCCMLCVDVFLCCGVVCDVLCSAVLYCGVLWCVVLCYGCDVVMCSRDVFVFVLVCCGVVVRRCYVVVCSGFFSVGVGVLRVMR